MRFICKWGLLISLIFSFSLNVIAQDIPLDSTPVPTEAATQAPTETPIPQSTDTPASTATETFTPTVIVNSIILPTALALPDGTYYWCVQGRDGAGNLGVPSSGRIFAIDSA